jgi:hypothetical protein
MFFNKQTILKLIIYTHTHTHTHTHTPLFEILIRNYFIIKILILC